MITVKPEKLKIYRIKAGLNQSELARKINSTPGSVSHWEKGTRGIEPSNANMLIDILNDIFTGKNIPPVQYEDIFAISKSSASSVPFSDCDRICSGMDAVQKGFVEEYMKLDSDDQGELYKELKSLRDLHLKNKAVAGHGGGKKHVLGNTHEQAS